MYLGQLHTCCSTEESQPSQGSLLFIFSCAKFTWLPKGDGFNKLTMWLIYVYKKNKILIDIYNLEVYLYFILT